MISSNQKVLTTLSLLAGSLHIQVLWKFCRLKDMTLTVRLLVLSSACQMVYIIGIGTPGILHLIFEEWRFGWTACKGKLTLYGIILVVPTLYSTLEKMFLSIKTMSSGICINTTGRFTDHHTTITSSRYNC